MSARTRNRPNDDKPDRQPRRRAGLSKAELEAIPVLDTVVGYKLRRAQLWVFQDFIESFTEMRLRPAEFSVLTVIARRPGLKQSEIAEELGIKRANFVALMDGLEARGLAERRKADADKRSHSLHLTSEGATFVREMMKVWRAHEQRLVDRIGGAEARDRLIDLLDRIVSDDGSGR